MNNASLFEKLGFVSAGIFLLFAIGGCEKERSVTGPNGKVTASSEAVVSKLSQNNSCKQYEGKGYCTDYIKTKVYIPWSGDAIIWYDQAKSYYPRGNEPRPCSIAVFKINGIAAGHVAWVESVGSKDFRVSHWNWGKLKNGIPKECAVTDKFGILTYTTFNKNDSRLIGFIYPCKNYRIISVDIPYAAYTTSCYCSN